jgi:hypothetical protein
MAETGFPQNPLVTNLNKVEKAPIFVRVLQERKKGCFVNGNKELFISVAI